MSNPSRRHAISRAAFAMLLAFVVSLGVAYSTARYRTARATAKLHSAVRQLDAITDAAPGDNHQRAAIAWGYAERLRLGLESPFRLIEAASRDPRITSDERRTVAWALLAHVHSGESHHVDPAALDGIGPTEAGRTAAGEQHLELIRAAIMKADNPRAAELAVRLAYSLATTEQLVEASAPMIAAEAAALLADGEIARREAAAVIRAARGSDPVDELRKRRASRQFYVERPVLLTPSTEIEQEAIQMVPSMLRALRAMRPIAAPTVATNDFPDPDTEPLLARHLFEAGALLPPAAPLAVTIQRYVPLVRRPGLGIDRDSLARALNAEMLVAVTSGRDINREHRRAVGRLLLASAVSMRSMAQEVVWFPSDSAPSPADVATSLGLAAIAFDPDVPAAWQPYYLRTLSTSVADLRRVLPAFRLSALQVRFRMTAPADSALAMHDPRSRTLHLPVQTAGGTLSHELAHDLDRQSAQQQGLAGYRSDIVARSEEKPNGRDANADDRLAASLRALREELSDASSSLLSARARAERPAEIFATHVDWFVASRLARLGVSNAFLSAVQDELLTGHVVHPERLRSTGRSRSLLTALESMTTVAPFAVSEHDPSVQTLLRWSLGGPVDRRIAAAILGGGSHAWEPPPMIGERSCSEDLDDRVMLVRMAAESRARGWLRTRARWMSEADRPTWARGTLQQAPWSDAVAERRVAELRDYILIELASGVALPAGLGAYAAPIAAKARCGTSH